jgi:transcriptional regulator with XRE-family HTH domain
MPKGAYMNKTMRAKIGVRVRFHRELRGLTQEQLATKADIFKRHLWGVENGNAGLSIETLQRISTAFGMKPSGLLAEAGY